MGDKMTLQDCIDLATFAHRHQRDKAGEPYINHPLRVLENVKAQGSQGYVQMAAVLHDVTEETPFTSEMLLTLGVPEAAVEIVKLVDRDLSKQAFFEKERWRQSILISWNDLDEGELKVAVTDYGRRHPGFFTEDVDEYYYEMIRSNTGALIVKMADIGDNLQPWRLSYLPESTQKRLREKYAKAIEQLNWGAGS